MFIYLIIVFLLCVDCLRQLLENEIPFLQFTVFFIFIIIIIFFYFNLKYLNLVRYGLVTYGL